VLDAMRGIRRGFSNARREYESRLRLTRILRLGRADSSARVRIPPPGPTRSHRLRVVLAHRSKPLNPRACGTHGTRRYRS
jgi:hypothetical protein